MAFEKVIIFGPTGNIGSVAAQTASKKGASVYLAMRDPKKAIPGLTKEAEQSGKYERIQADLTNAESIRSAVEKSGAEAAFLYLAHGTPDHMLSTFQALKDGGIKQVVFLSSFTVPKEKMEDVQPSDLISFMHAQAELSMRKHFAKDQVVAIRPGYFATNLVGQHKQGIIERKVKLVNPDSLADMITNEDMGEVAGTVLVEGQRDGQDFIYLFGPEMIPEKAAYQAVGRLLGAKIEVVKVDADEGLKELIREGLPEPIAKYLVGLMQETADGKDVWGALKEMHGEGVENVKKYTGHAALTFEEWAGRNKQMFV
jgi:NAD(P)-dependent dehydrogenase (short-subunit alcohol dehydrogenase family)